MQKLKPAKNLFGVFIFLAFSFFFFFNAYAIEYGGIGGRPAFPRADNPRTESIFIHNLEPGDIQEDGILVVNNSPDKKTILVYGVDSTPSTGGSFACKQFSEPKNNVGNWIILEKNEVTLDSKKSELIPFTINVPENVSVGEHNGCIVVQEKIESNPSQGGVNLSFRTGLRLAVVIPGELERKLEIVDFNVAKTSDANFLLQPKVKNSGNVSIDTNIKVITKYFFGKNYSSHGGQYPILRGETSDWSFELKKPFWGGWYRSDFLVEYDDDLGAGIGLRDEENLKVLKSSSVLFFSFPSTIALFIEIFVFLLIVFVVFVLWFRQKRKNWIKKNWVLYEIKLGEDIKLLAEKFSVSWKLLARVNKLKAPYALKSGEKIKVPPREK